MDSFEINKVAGAVLGTLTLTLGLVIAADGLLTSHAPEKPGYELAEPAEESAGGDAPAAAAVEPIAVRLATADAAKGEAVAKRCASCHDFTDGGPNKVGPNLYNIVNAKKAHLDNFTYSAAMKEAGTSWTYDNLDHFLENPKGYIAGTSMSFAGLKKPDERANLIAYLRTLSASPAALPEAAPAATEEKPAEPAENAPADAGTPAPAEGNNSAPPAGKTP